MKCKTMIFAAMLTAALLFCAGGNIADAGMQGVNRVVIPIENVTDKDRQSESFIFRIEKCSADCPDPEKTEVRIRGSGTAAFVINVGKLGRFDYEISGSDDSSQYHVIIAAVRNERNEMQTSLIITDGGTGKPEKIVFTNLSDKRKWPSGGSKKKKKNNKGKAETGDPFNESLCITLALSAFAVLFITFIRNRKARKKQGKETDIC